MKILISFLAFMFYTCIVNSQVNFVGYEVNKYIGKDLKVIEKSESLQSYGFDGFVTKYDKITSPYSIPEKYVLFPDKSGKHSDYSSLVGKLFKCNAVKEFPNKTDYFILDLSNPEIGNVYYIYSAKFKHNFVFEVIGGFDIPKGYFCGDIKETYDKFKQEKGYESPLLQAVYFKKIIREDQPIYYMRLAVNASRPEYGEGVTILLKNGQRIEKPNEKNDMQVTDDGFSATAFFQLTEEDIKKLIDNEITDVKVYIFEGMTINAEKYKDYIYCLTQKN